MLVVATGVASSVILARAMGPDGVGQFGLFRRLATLVAAGTSLGLGSASIYFLNNRRIPVSEITALLLRVLLIVAVPLVAGLWLVVVTCRTYFGDVPSWLALVFSVGVAALLGTALLRAVLAAGLMARRMVVVDVLPGLVMLGGAAVLAICGWLTAAGAIALFAAGALGNCTMLLWFLRPHLGLSVRFQWGLLARLLAYGMKLYAANLLLLGASTLTLMLLRYLTVESFTEVGLYGRAVAIATLVALLPRAVSPLLYAKWAGVTGLERRGQVEMTARVNVSYGLITSLVVIFAGKYIIWLMYGRAFMPAQSALAVLGPAVGAMSLCAVFNNLLASDGRAGMSIWIFAGNAAIAIAGTWFLVPVLGIRGAAIAVLGANTFAAVVMMLVCWKIYGVRPQRCLLLCRTDMRYIASALFGGGKNRKQVRQQPESDEQDGQSVHVPPT